MILRDRDTGPAPLRVLRMLAFAADTLRRTALASDAYRGAHRGAARAPLPRSIRWLGTGLLLLSVLLSLTLFPLAYEGFIIYQLATGPNLPFSVTLALLNLVVFRRQLHPAATQSLATLVLHQQDRRRAGLSIRAIASSSGCGHPLLFAIISYSGYAISVACLRIAVVQAARYLSGSSPPPPPTQPPKWRGSDTIIDSLEAAMGQHSVAADHRRPRS